MRVVVGLGNPGTRYARTRHNIGFLVADELAGSSNWTEQHQALTTVVRIGDDEALVVKPQTFMNRSGVAVQALLDAAELSPAEVLVVTDDFLFDFGRARLRRSGSDGGHNGLASIIERLQTQEFARLRLGVGPVPEAVSDIDFVLAPFTAAEDVSGLVQRGRAATCFWVQQGIEAAMNRFNGCPALLSCADRD